MPDRDNTVIPETKTTVTPPSTIGSDLTTRRGALRTVLAHGAVITVIAPIQLKTVEAASEPEFKPENDYPYFGYQPPFDSEAKTME